VFLDESPSLALSQEMLKTATLNIKNKKWSGFKIFEAIVFILLPQKYRIIC